MFIFGGFSSTLLKRIGIGTTFALHLLSWVIKMQLRTSKLQVVLKSTASVVPGLGQLATVLAWKAVGLPCLWLSTSWEVLIPVGVGTLTHGCDCLWW